MEHATKILVPLVIGGLDLSITTPVAWLFVATLLLIIFCSFAIRKITLIPRSYSQNILELTVEFIENQIIRTTGIDKSWTVMSLTIFLFILFNKYHEYL